MYTRPELAIIRTYTPQIKTTVALMGGNEIKIVDICDRDLYSAVLKILKLLVLALLKI